MISRLFVYPDRHKPTEPLRAPQITLPVIYWLPNHAITGAIEGKNPGSSPGKAGSKPLISAFRQSSETKGYTRKSPFDVQ